MREYGSQAIRNIAVVGHGSSGKTTLVDALAFVSGTSKRHGSIKDGTTLTDNAPEETERKFSISLGCACAEWKETKINLLDTPGFLDFQGDAIAGIAAADGALVAVGASTGVEAGTERMFREAIARKDPVLFVVATIDREHADFDAAYQSIKERLTTKVVPVEIPIGAGAGLKGVINLFTKRAHLFKPGTKAGEYEETDIPASEQARFERYRQEMVEAVAATWRRRAVSWPPASSMLAHGSVEISSTDSISSGLISPAGAGSSIASIALTSSSDSASRIISSSSIPSVYACPEKRCSTGRRGYAFTWMQAVHGVAAATARGRLRP